MRYVVAVSGGVDSVVLLDQLAAEGDHELIVAHFDHGIRPDAAADARFVKGLADRYGLPFVARREELGATASEDVARRRRYAFLREVARHHQASIVTAHHADDVIETIAINLKRGTGWRGLVVLAAADVVRPLLMKTKSDIREYALRRRLEWVEDSTNASSDYLRNRIRQRVALRLMAEQKQRLLALWQQQLSLKDAIETETAGYGGQHEYSRYYLNQIDERSASELLRAAIIAKNKVSPTRPQMLRALLAIKTARPHTTFELGGGVRLRFTVRTFIVETP